MDVFEPPDSRTSRSARGRAAAGAIAMNVRDANRSLSGAHTEDLLRAGFGAALLLRPGPLLRAAPHRHADDRAVLVARALGVRHLAESLLLVAGRAPGWTALGCAIDGIHALTAFAFALTDRRYRRLAVTNGVTATGFALAGAHRLGVLA